MIKRIWNFAGSLRVTFWLCLAAAVWFLCGNIWAGGDGYSIITKLNRMRLQDWMAAHYLDSFAFVWWMVPLLATLFFLGINTAVCTINRMAALVPRRREMPFKRFLVLLSPSLIHALFFIVVLGHLVTFTLGEWNTVAVSEGGKVAISPSSPEMTVASIEKKYFDRKSDLFDRIAQISVKLTDDGNRATTVSFMNPVSLSGRHVFLDMEKQKKKMKPEAPVKKPAPVKAEPETCNKAHVCHAVKKEPEEQKIFLLVINDPGLFIIVTAFGLILILMTWYFIESRRTGNNA